MTVKQHIYNQQGEIETVTELIQGCNNITYEKMTEGYYTWEMYSSMSNICALLCDKNVIFSGVDFLRHLSALCLYLQTRGQAYWPLKDFNRDQAVNAIYANTKLTRY